MQLPNVNAKRESTCAVKSAKMHFMNKPMTLEEFREGLNDLVAEVEDPNSEISVMMTEGTGLSSQLREFDPILADKMQLIFDNVGDLVSYVKSRKERN